MERALALINRLLEQYHENAGADKMLVTLHILAAELEMEKNKMVQKSNGVSVVAPALLKKHDVAGETVAAMPPVPVVAQVKMVVTEAPPAETPAPKTPQPVSSYNTLKYNTAAPAPRDITEVHDLNEILGRKVESLNERLKTNSVELSSLLQSSPVKDLKKAIGINDRYVFLNELFRGDEQMYERSIKTINSFSIFAEADFWIKRELKSKLGWDEDAEAVIQFDQLVRRRFS